MKCDICGKVLEHNGFVFDVRSEDQLHLCQYCYQFIMDLKCKADEEQVISNANAYFSSIPDHTDDSYANSSISAAKFTLNGVSIPLTLEYIRNHPDHDLSNHTLIIHETNGETEALKEIRKLLEKHLDGQQALKESNATIARHTGYANAMATMGLILGAIGFIVFCVSAFR